MEMDEASRQGQDLDATSEPLPPDYNTIPDAWGGTWEAYYDLCKRYEDNFVKQWPVLEAYRGKYVALWPDGTQIVDSDADGVVLWQRLKERGQQPHLLAIEYIRRPDEEVQC
jgi:hypothetical protein